MGRASGLARSPPARGLFWEARARPKPDPQGPKARRAFFGPKIGRFLANFWLNLDKIMGIFVTKKFFIFLAGNRPKIGRF